MRAILRERRRLTAARWREALRHTVALRAKIYWFAERYLLLLLERYMLAYAMIHAMLCHMLFTRCHC